MQYFDAIKSIKVEQGEIILEATVKGKLSPDKIRLYVWQDQFYTDYNPAAWEE